jgi:RNA polymerase sigma factor (sigma-70 family)
LLTKGYETPALLVAAIGQGDRQAESALFERYYKQTLFLLERKTGDPDQAQDLCQEALLIVIERLRSQPLDDPERLATFLYSTAINLHIGERRKAVRRKTHTDQELMGRVLDKGPSQLKILINERASIAVRQLIAAMDNIRDRRLLYGYYIEEKDKDDLCAELELSQRHFDKVIFRAKQRFKELLLEGKS